MEAFIMWAACGTIFVIMGIYDIFSKRTVPFGFWANIKVEGIKDVKKYNRAVGLLFLVFGIVFILLGLFLLAGEDTPLIIFSVLGVMLEAILAMAVYSLVIERKYRER